MAIMTQITAIDGARALKGVKPFIKWAGGKSRLLAQYEPFFPPSFRRYFEPFLGSGAVYLHLQAQPAVLSDSNSDLVNCWQVVRDQVESLIAHLEQHQVDRDYYYRLRACAPEQLAPVERASRLIFLNKTCYNGLYRVNRAGQFNVPFGDYKKPRIFQADHLRAVSALMQPVKIIASSFDRVLREARRGDFIYFDPPYLPLSSTSNFTGYTGQAFGVAQQEYLAEVYRTLHSRRCLLMLSNSNTQLIRDLYCGFRIEEVWAGRAINSVATRRQPIRELVVMNY